MSSKFASGKWAIAECDICGFRVKLRDLKEIVVKNNPTQILACFECWNPSHPQLQLGTFPIEDPQALRNPRRDLSYLLSGLNPNDFPSDGSRTIQWGWAPVGGSTDDNLTPNNLLIDLQLGSVTVS
jgi:hypothetical protein